MEGTIGFSHNNLIRHENPGDRNKVRSYTYTICTWQNIYRQHPTLLPGVAVFVETVFAPASKHQIQLASFA
jgi:hypothetical protein